MPQTKLPSAGKKQNKPSSQGGQAALNNEEAPKPKVKPGRVAPKPEVVEDGPVVTTIEKTRNPIMTRPVDYDNRWHPSRFKASNHEVKIDVPIAITGDERRLPNELDLRNLTSKQRLGLSLMTQGMLTSGARLDDGSEVNSRQQMIKKQCEVAADAYWDSLAKTG